MAKARCRARLQGGKRCQNEALPGSDLCAVHSKAARRPSLLDGVISAEEAERLSALLADPRVDDALLVLAYTLRQAVLEGANLKEIIRACDSYVKALSARHRISGQAAQSLEQAIEAALDAIAAELGVEL
jgi:hypothetical protein